MADVSDPLRFGTEDDDGQEDVLLDDGPPMTAAPPPLPVAAAPAAAAPAPPEAAPAAGGLGDPLSLAASSREEAPLPRYHDVVGAQQHAAPPAAAAAGPLGAAAPGPAAAAGPAPHHRQQASLTLDSLEINADDAGFLRGRGAGTAGGSSSGSAGAGPSTSAAPPPLHITVSDPVRRVGDSVIPGFSSTHFEYLVTTAGEAPRRRVEVRRRFKDFVALADLLAVTHRGFFVFPRPDKNTLDQQLGKSDFVELRRADLERYLRKLAVHPVVGASEELRVFLEAEGSLATSLAWQQLQPTRGSLAEGIARLPRQLIGSEPSVPSTVEAQQNAKNTSDLLRRFRELGERMRQEYQSGAQPVLSEEEQQLRERKAGVEELAEKLAGASRRAERLVKEFEELGAVMGDFGLSLVKLAKFEDEEGTKCGQYSELGVGARAVANDARRVGLAAVRQSRLARAANGQAMEALEPLHDELAMSPAMAAALREREAALLTVQSIEDDLDKKRRAAAALDEAGARRVGGDAAKQRKVAALQNEVSALEAALEAARREYERVKARNLQELERTRGERAADFSRLSRGVAEVQSLYAQRCQEIWAGVADDFGAAAGGSGSGGGWFEHPYTGSCGYGRLDGYAFGPDAVAAMPDVNPDWKAGSCGRCYELKCRGIQARSADGSVDLDRSDACYDTSKRIIIKIVDTCPCQGNEASGAGGWKWCCGDAGLVHFDLSDGAFRRLAPQGKGIVGLAWRPVPCEAAATNGTASSEAQAALDKAVAAGGSPKVFTGADLGVGWKKAIYGDDLKSMYTYNSSISTQADGSRALCTSVEKYGGFYFETQAPRASVFVGAEAVEFWARPGDGASSLPTNLVLRLGNTVGRACTKESPFTNFATQDTKDGWTRIYAPLSAFDCENKGEYGAAPADLNRIQWENKGDGKASLCVKDVQIIPQGGPPVVAQSGDGGRRRPPFQPAQASTAQPAAMGVAGLFAFLRRKYPEIVDACAQQAEEVAEGESTCDNLYLDLNHIIHIDLYLDRLVGLMRPTRLLLLAMDGVAPTAKMNQQRGRRFYAAHLERQKADIEAQVRREMAAELGPDGASAIADLQLPAFDGNVITPGTGFMARLSAHLRLFLEQKLACDPDWQHLAVVFSDSSEPGEGEHKILRFIRQQRTQPDYDPNTRHCIFGQDADLILLGLLSCAACLPAVHEPHFCLLRESGRLEAVLEATEGEEEGEVAPFWSPVGQQPLELLRLSTLRDFLRCEFAEFVADPAEQQQQGRQGQAGSPAVDQAGSGAGSGSEAEGGGGAVTSGGDSAGGSPAGAVGLAPAGGGTGGGSGRSSLDGHQEEGELDLITGEKKRVHPSVLRKLAKKAAKAQQAQQAQQEADHAEQAGAVGPAAAGGGGGGSKGGARFDFERILDDVVCCTFLAGNDFVPQLPSLDIYDRPSALQTLLDKYKELLSSRRGYLTGGGRIDPDKLCWLFGQLAGEEEATFQARERRKVQEQRRKMHQEAAAAGGSGREGGPAGASWMGDGWVSVGELAPGQSLDEALAGTAWGGNPDVPTAAQFAGDPAALRRELARRVRERMSDRADAGMAADPVRLAMPGYRARFYTKCFDAPAPSGPELEQLVRRVCASFCRTLCWNLAYYCRGSSPVAPPSLQATDEDSPPGGRAAKSSNSDTPYASWQVHYEFHYAPLASDLAKYGREALKGAAAAACRPHPPIQPFAQLCSVLPFSSMPTCLPPLLARAAEDPADGLAALHGSEAGDVFPQDVSALVDLSGKKWAHTAVVRLPFPDVEAISGFVREQLDSEDCRLSEEERRRNQFASALLMLPEGHPMAPRLQERVGGSSSGGSGENGGTAGAAAAEEPPDAAAGCASILSLLLPPGAADGRGSVSQPAAQMAGVLCWPLDLAGQDTPAFAAGLLPGEPVGK
ncbi:sorting nexin 2B [Chlorella sorokiniana]|uniref:Sorting nexin 2B n=1 Tax=Chlorella sorokiniana TaxID=3076 RepID=A0A2P6TTG7_CHLSO|nr:sorting nexin 2B [Chlorella sorokiniana]|eukprot:PRW57356.1 sorting nexin 2B [Chlorella sorokiniana]